MDLTEAFRSEDISKTDFFDFVVAPDASENQQTLNFNRTLKSMGIFIDNPNDHHHHHHNGNSNGTAEFQDAKEEMETNNNNNNNHLMMTSSGEMTETIVGGNFVDHPFWTTTCDKETVRLETAILEDLNKFCWNQEPEISVNNVGTTDKDPLVSATSANNNNNNNTDGAIYTLTVLNGDHGSATWYRAPESTVRIKEEDAPQPSPHHDLDHHHHPLNSAHHPNQQQQSSTLDLDSILSIIPNHSQNGHHYQQQNGFQTSITSHLEDEHNMKSEYTYDDSGYATKDSVGHIGDNNHLMDGETNFNNNNNDWKLSNNNNNNTSNADSLLRSALQGKSFLGRYNGPKNGIKPLDGHTELRRALSTPPNGSKTPLDQSPVFIGSSEEDMEMKHHSPLLVMDQNSIIYDEGRVLGIVDSDNPSSTHSMDDILLSQLDAVSYPEDYEKLKRIANEVAESVGHYCNLDPVGSPQSIYLNAHDLGMSTSNHALSPAASGTKGSKKFGKKQSNGTKPVHNSPVHGNNGVRKERSLHYCSICSKGFKDKYSVNVHIRTHTGEKPFACSLCGKSFRQKAHLAKHYQTHIAQKNAAANNNGVAKSGNKRFATAKSS